MEKSHGASLGTGKTSESTPNNLSDNRNNFFNSSSHEKIDSEKSINSGNLIPGSDWITTPINSKKNQKKNNGKIVPSESSLTGNQASSEKNLKYLTHQKRKGNSPATNEMMVPNKNLKGSSPLSPFLAQIDNKSPSSNSGSVRSENLRAAPIFQGHHHRAGLSCLVIHRFQGIPTQFPKSISTILDILISQGLMPSLLRQITDQFFAFWELDNYVLTVGKSESFSRLGFRQ